MPGAVIGLDFGAIAQMAGALGCHPEALAEYLPVVEAGMLAALAHSGPQERGEW